LEKQPRIALVTYAMHCGGMESFLLRLAAYFHEQGCSVELITTVERGEWFGRLAELGIPAHHVPGYRSSGLLNPLQHTLRVSAQLRRGNYEAVLLNHSRHAQAGLARLPEPVVAIPILHNDSEPIYQVGCGNADAWNVAVAVSRKVADTAQQRVPRRPVLEITSGVELPTASQWQSRRGWSRPLQLIYIGRLDHAQKGVLWLPPIYRACLNRGVECLLTVVGDGPDAAALRQLLSDEGLAERTQFLRGLTPEQVYQQLLAAHVLLMPSFYEGMPIALLESLACGCVPVVSRLPGITDAAVVDGETGFLAEIGDPRSFADAVATLQNQPERWRAMSRAAHESAVLSYSVESMGRSYLELIREAQAGRYPLPLPRLSQRAVDLALFSWKDFLPDPVRRLGQRGRAWQRALSARSMA
jgi:glycosyltransferase involved in cell wall biosynthesis